MLMLMGVAITTSVGIIIGVLSSSKSIIYLLLSRGGANWVMNLVTDELWYYGACA
jgi:hypothetical protein